LSFKACTSCRVEWETREDLLSDPAVTLAGYQADFEELEAGFFLFNHSCSTTFALGVDVFKELYEGPVFSERRTGAADCPGYCLRKDELRPCPAHCECAWVREVVRIVSRWKKKKKA